MGQYYTVVKVKYSEKNNKALGGLEHCSLPSSKLMECSWIGNDFMGWVMKRMTPGQPWHKKRIVWAGDYYGDREGEIKLYRKGKEILDGRKYEYDCKEKGKEPDYKEYGGFLTEQEQKNCFIINHSKQEYISIQTYIKNVAQYCIDYKQEMDKKKKNWIDYLPNKWMWKERKTMIIHPLSLMLALGNGEGIGDYDEDNPNYDLVGTWAFDIISVDTKEPIEYKELDNIFFSELAITDI